MARKSTSFSTEEVALLSDLFEAVRVGNSPLVSRTPRDSTFPKLAERIHRMRGERSQPATDDPFVMEAKAAGFEIEREELGDTEYEVVLLRCYGQSKIRIPGKGGTPEAARVAALTMLHRAVDIVPGLGASG